MRIRGIRVGTVFRSLIVTHAKGSWNQCRLIYEKIHELRWSRRKPVREGFPGPACALGGRRERMVCQGRRTRTSGRSVLNAFGGQGFVTVVVCCLSTIPLPVSVVVVVDDVDSDGMATLGAVRLVDSLV